MIRQREGVRFDRAHFKTYGAYSLDYEIVYYVLSPDYNTYMDHQHAINLGLYSKFEDAGIPFAFPTQTLIIAGDGKDEDGKSPGPDRLS